MPAASAGLLRFFEEESGGPKISPTAVVLFGILFIVASVALPLLF